MRIVKFTVKPTYSQIEQVRLSNVWGRSIFLGVRRALFQGVGLQHPANFWAFLHGRTWYEHGEF